MKSANKVFFSILFSVFINFSFIVTAPSSSKVGSSEIADWTIHIYVQSKNNLNKFAIKNLNDIATIGSTANFNILVQWYQLHQQGVWRYKIEKNKIILDTYLPVNTDGNGVEDLVDSCRWAINKYPSQKYFLILWNHGFGIIDPVWGRLRGISPLSPLFFDNPRAQIEGITKSYPLDLDRNRAILFNESTKTYMDNQSFVEALRKVKNEVLRGKKIDILGMDACLMAMLEVAYQARNYADYMVASQEVELAHGWDYLSIMNELANKRGKFSAEDLAKSIVFAYEEFYKDKIRFYTQSAMDLNNITYIKDNLDQLVVLSDECIKHDSSGFKGAIKSARKKSLQFSSRNYVDLYSFYSQFHEILEKDYLDEKNNKNFSRLDVNKKNLLLKTINNLKSVLEDGKKLIESSIIANVAGSRLAVAKGLSIYFPTNRIDNSYVHTDFAKEGLWLNFLKQSF